MFQCQQDPGSLGSPTPCWLNPVNRCWSTGEALHPGRQPPLVDSRTHCPSRNCLVTQFVIITVHVHMGVSLTGQQQYKHHLCTINACLSRLADSIPVSFSSSRRRHQSQNLTLGSPPPLLSACLQVAEGRPDHRSGTAVVARRASLPATPHGCQ